MESNKSQCGGSLAEANVAPDQGPPRSIAPSRACEECKRKKTKCDMKRPACSLCSRARKTCHYPTQRRRPEFRRNSSGKAKRSRHELEQKIDSLMELMTQKSAPAGMTTKRVSTSSSQADLRRNSSSGTGAFWSTQGHQSVEPDVLLSPILPGQAAGDMEWVHSDCHSLQQELNQVKPGQWDIRNGFDPAFDDGLSMLDNMSPMRAGYDGDTFGGSQEDQSQNMYHESQPEYVLEPVLPLPNPPAAIPRSTNAQTRRNKTHSMSEPTALIDQLIELFFDKIHGFLPIFCRQRFRTEHFSVAADAQGRYENIPANTAFILYGMMSLAARFSDSPIFKDVNPLDRGSEFANQARSFYENFRCDNEDGTPSLGFLHGSLLLDFYLLTAGPCHFGWVLTGICIRLAYDLGLDRIDEDIITEGRTNTAQWSSVEEWARREGLRRAWWAVWELDAYASTVAGRPYAIDSSQFLVLLPVPDENWFSKTPVASAALDPDPTIAYKCLRGCDNQDERAWFLVVLALVLQAHALWRRTAASKKAQEELESVLSCFAMILPEKFDASPGTLYFTRENFQQCNWIVSTNVLLQSARIITALIGDKRCIGRDTACSPSSEETQSSTPPAETHEMPLKRCRQFTKEACRAIRVWSSAYIPLASPFIVTSLIGPAAVHFCDHSHHENGRSSIDQEMLELTIGKFAKYWKLGSLMLDLAQALKAPVLDMRSISKLAGDDLPRRIATILP